MRCLVLGGDGMLGHQLLESWRSRHVVCVTVRGPLADYRKFGLFTRENTYDQVDVRQTDRLLQVLAEFRPQAVINASGIIKQRKASKESLASLEVNSVFPHRLRLMCEAIGARMVHLSTDCVFNGTRGNYHECDPADAHDLYGLSKYLGEVSDSPCITIRSSIIGLELARKASLVEWFLAQQGTIRGFTRAIYSGITTLEMARLIERLITDWTEVTGVWQVAAEPISKYELLCRFAKMLGRRDVVIEPDDSFRCDRSLDGTSFSKRTGYLVPSWESMLLELAEQVHEKGYLQHAA